MITNKIQEKEVSAEMSGTNSDKKLGLMGLVVLLISAMIGSGIFDLPKNMSVVSGATGQIIAWITTAIGMWFIAETFVMLSDTNPTLTAGLYKYGEVGFGPLVGFLSAWGYFICECFSIVAYAVLMMSTFNYFLPGVFTGGNNLNSTIGSSIVTWIIFFLVLGGSNVSSTIQKVATTITFIVMIIFVGTALYHFKWATFTTNMSAGHNIAHLKDVNLGSLHKQILGTMMITLWLFGGIEGAVVMSGKAKKQSQIPKATIIGFISCTILYAAINLLPLGTFSYGELAHMQSPSTAEILTRWWHSNLGRNVITIALLIAVSSSWISWVQMLAELPQRAAAEDHTFPKFFAKRSKKDVPVNSILIATLVMQITIIIAHFNQNAYQTILIITGTMTIGPYLISSLYLVKISRNKDVFPTISKHRQPTTLFVGIVATLYILIMAYSAGIKYVTLSFVVYLLGIPLYIWARKEQHDGKPIFNLTQTIIVIVMTLIAIAGIIVLVIK